MKLILPQASRLNMASLKVELVNAQGSSLKTLTMNGNTASFDLPSAKSFKIRLTGKTLTGAAFQRTSREIRPQAAIIRTQLDQSLLKIRPAVATPLRIAIDYLGSESKTFNLKVTVIPSSVNIWTRSSVTATNAGPTEFSVDLTTLSSAPLGSVVKVYVQAKSGDVELNNVAYLMVKH